VGLPAMIAGGFRYVVPVILVSILVALLTMIGYVMLIIPGIIISMALAVAIPVVVAEEKGILAALERSAELTKGNRWGVFGVMFVVGILSALLEFISGLLQDSLISVFGEYSFAADITVFLVQTAVAVALGGAVAASLFVQLRKCKEGASIDEITEVFA